MRATIPSAEMLDAFRRHRANLPRFTNLYPYAMGRIEGALDDTSRTLLARVNLARQIIAALDMVESESLPDREPKAKECPVSPLPSGKHQVDTSMESGPNNCFFCEQPMGASNGLR